MLCPMTAIQSHSAIFRRTLTLVASAAKGERDDEGKDAYHVLVACSRPNCRSTSSRDLKAVPHGIQGRMYPASEESTIAFVMRLFEKEAKYSKASSYCSSHESLPNA